jgi:hypothetical protein
MWYTNAALPSRPWFCEHRNTITTTGPRRGRRAHGEVKSKGIRYEPEVGRKALEARTRSYPLSYYNRAATNLRAWG